MLEYLYPNNKLYVIIPKEMLTDDINKKLTEVEDQLLNIKLSIVVDNNSLYYPHPIGIVHNNKLMYYLLPESVLFFDHVKWVRDFYKEILK
jgi:hypothetical protein